MTFPDPQPSPSAERPWIAIAAMSANRAIGLKGDLPWHLPEDLKWLKHCTRGKSVVMGRKTFETLPKPLPNRENIIISRTASEIPGCVVLPSLEALQQRKSPNEVWILGGAEVYRQAMDRVSDLFLTYVYGNFEADAFFPPFEAAFEDPEVILTTDAFEIRHYRAR